MSGPSVLRRCSGSAPAAREVLPFDLSGVGVNSAPPCDSLQKPPQILTFPKINERRQMSAATAGSAGNFYEKRAKVTHGRLNKARADWLLLSTFRESNRSCFCLQAVTPKQIRVGSSAPQQELPTPLSPCLQPSWEPEPCQRLSQPGWGWPRGRSLGLARLAGCSGSDCASRQHLRPGGAAAGFFPVDPGSGKGCCSHGWGLRGRTDALPSELSSELSLAKKGFCGDKPLCQPPPSKKENVEQQR